MAKKAAGDAKGDGPKVVARNRRATFDYFLGDRYEAGLVLTGTEVKALRTGKGSIGESWVRLDKSGEAFLIQAHIPEYEYGNRTNHKPTRERKLLLHRREIDRLAKEMATQGITLVPTQLYFSGGRAKLEFAVGRGKDTHDKRQSLKAKQAKRETDRAIKTHRS